MLELKQLRYLVAISESGSLTAAARTLGVSQPTLTVAVRQLEQSFGTTLLLRDRSGVRLTRTGEVLRDYAQQVLVTVKRAEETIVNLEGAHNGHFVIGCHESLGGYLLPGFLPGFFEEEPKIGISLWTASSAEVTQAVVQRKVDFGLVVNAEPHPNLVITRLFHDAMDFFVRQRPGEREPSLSAAHQRLREGPLVFAGRVWQSQRLIDWMAAQSLLPPSRLDCGGLELVKSLAHEGMGVALLPRRVALHGQPGLRRLHGELPSVPDTISLLQRADAHKTKAQRALKSALVAHGRALETKAPSR